MKIIRLNELVNKRLGRKDPVPVFFQYPSIGDYGKFVDNSSTTNEQSEADAEAAADELENALFLFNDLTDDEY